MTSSRYGFQGPSATPHLRIGQARLFTLCLVVHLPLVLETARLLKLPSIRHCHVLSVWGFRKKWSFNLKLTGRITMPETRPKLSTPNVRTSTEEPTTATKRMHNTEVWNSPKHTP